MLKYDKQMMFKCTEEEREQIKRLARNSKMTTSEYIRFMVLGKESNPRKPYKQSNS